ncbi:acetyl-CoA hydrolase [Hornefia porci]|uniref:Acetyl-CoA hydrolase n=1 Tax=Hornefia porci TaxID=2652292 RepID=A0A1Q9JI41_9FIRM|nr:acetyl-CoA hydrolase/transferase C-terminal domain-containing protein [Hornefia porci]OLR55892.1 acetyl-CoA hydrolase [Hornefia porci]
MDYKKIYREKIVSVEEALSHIHQGDRIMTSLCAQAPFLLLKNLHKVAEAGVGFKIYSNMDLFNYPYLVEEKYRDLIDVDSLFEMDGDRAGHRKGLVNYVPGHLHDGSWRWADYYKPNVFIGAVSSMDEHGFCRFSLSNIHEKEFARRADVVICEVNPRLPQVNGDTEIHISDIDYIVESKEPIPVLPETLKLSPEDEAIGGYVSTLVNDGDTIQLGIGKIPDAVANGLMEKQDLGVHTELMTDAIYRLTEAGAVTNRKKTLFRGKSIATFALGSQKLYDMMHQNPGVWIMPGDLVNDSHIIAKNDNMVSINTAIEVDLTGQVCSESIGTLQYSGTGGAVDTSAGAGASKGGRSIICLHSTAKKGERSTINAMHTPGAIVTLSRNNVDYIVTEYGIAPMRGRNIRQRIQNLVAVAHPDFRTEIRKDAEKYQLW